MGVDFVVGETLTLLCTNCFQLLALQGMVDRADLLIALSENNTLREDARANEKDLAFAKTQLDQAREQLDQARLSESLLQLQLGSMVPRSKLEASQAEVKELNEDNSILEQKLLDVKTQIDKLKVQIEVSDLSFTCPLWLAYTDEHLPYRAWCKDPSSWLRYQRPTLVEMRLP